MRLWGALAPGLDVIVYLAASALAVPPERAQLLGFAAAVVLGYAPRALGAAAPGARGAGLALRLAAVTLLAFFIRSPLFDLLTGAWRWPGPAAIVVAALATAGMLGPGYGWCMADRSWQIGGGARWRAGAAGAVAAAAALRLLYAGRVELLPEETYYWNYAQHLDIGYLDHPPMVAWLIAAGTRLFGDAEFGVRAGALLSGAVSAFFMYRLTRNLFGAPSAVAAVLLAQTLPFFFLAGMLMTPDAALTAAWAASLYYMERALIAEERRAWWPLGVCFGLGLLSKYTIGLLGLSTLLFMLIDPRARRWLRRPEPYAAAALALLVFSPVIVWNARNHWASFLFQTSRRLADRPQFALHKLIASALVLLTPTGFAATALFLGGGAPPAGPAPAGSEEDRRRGWRLLKVATLTPLAIFALFSLRHEVKLDWMGAPWLAAVPALAFAIVQGALQVARGARALIRRTWAPTLAVLLLIYGAGLYDLALGIPGVGYGRHAELVPVGWRELGTQVAAIARDAAPGGGAAPGGSGPPLVVGMDRYAIASELAFYTPDRPAGVADTSSAHLLGQVGLMYERWFPPAALEGRTLLLVAWHRGDLEAPAIAADAARLGPIEEGTLTRGDDLIRRYYYRFAYGYRGRPAPPQRP